MTASGKVVPKLADYIASGTIWIEGNDYVGRASDGVIVAIGNVGLEPDVESYLETYTPDKW